MFIDHVINVKNTDVSDEFRLICCFSFHEKNFLQNDSESVLLCFTFVVDRWYPESFITVQCLVHFWSNKLSVVS